MRTERESKILTGLFDDSVSDKVSLVSHQDDWLAEEEAPGAELREDQLGLAQSAPVVHSHHHQEGVRGVEGQLGLQRDLPVFVVYEEKPGLLLIDRHVDLFTHTVVCNGYWSDLVWCGVVVPHLRSGRY